MGQGGAMAIEDAVGIAALLPFGIKAQEIPARLKLYESNADLVSNLSFNTPG